MAHQLRTAFRDQLRRGEDERNVTQVRRRGVSVSEIETSFTEALAVVGGQQDDRVAAAIHPAHRTQELAHPVIGVENLAGVPMAVSTGKAHLSDHLVRGDPALSVLLLQHGKGGFGAEGPIGKVTEKVLGRVVGTVGILVVNPEEEARLPWPLQPGDRPPGGELRNSLDVEGPIPHRGGHLVVVDLESPVQSDPAFQDDVAQEGGSLVAGVSEDLSQRDLVGETGEAVPRSDRVLARVERGHDGGVGGSGHAAGGDGAFEKDAARRQFVDVRAHLRLESVAAQVVGTKGVDRDQDDRAVVFRALRARGKGEDDAGQRRDGKPCGDDHGAILGQ